MTNEIVQSKQELTWNGKRMRASKELVFKALAPMFVIFPNLEMSDETFGAYYMMLCDLDPDKLAAAVVLACQAHEYPTQLITVAAIRKAYDGERQAPGPRSDVDPAALPRVPQKFFRLPEDEDRRERMERLRQTRNWDKFYS